MSMNRSLLGLVSALAALAGTPAAPELAKKTITELAIQSADVAVIRVIDSRAIDYEYDGKRERCGYRVHARVLESFKGTTQPTIDFLDVTDPERDEIGDQFLLFAIDQSNIIEGGQDPSSRDDARRRCIASGARKIVTKQPRRLLSIIASTKSRQLWLLVPAGGQIDLTRYSVEPVSDPAPGYLIPWAEVRGEIIEALWGAPSNP